MKVRKADQPIGLSDALSWMLSQKGVGHSTARKFLLKIGIGDLTDTDSVRKKLSHFEGMVNSINLPSDQISRVIRDLEISRINQIPFWSEDFPSQLLRLKDHPTIIFTKGDTTHLVRKAITIVGTRKNTLYGSRITRKMIEIIKQVDPEIAIVSGLAYGTDSLVHRHALQNNMSTIAITAGGVDRGFPRRNEALYDEIVEKGLLISEFPPGVEVVKGMFPMRNRLLAAISELVIVVESGITGGSMITARYAADLGVDVLAVPGDIGRDVAEGCNKLLSEGAISLYSLQLLKEYLEMK